MSHMNNGNNNCDLNGNGKTPFLIGVGGGPASGKSSVCSKIMQKLGEDCVDDKKRRVVCISQDSFYKELTDEEKQLANDGCYNFDHPNALDNQLIFNVLKSILSSKTVQLPIWDYKIHSRNEDEFLTVYPADVVLFEGILVFYFPEIRELFHMKLFVDTDPDTRLSRRVLRDVKELGRDLDHVLNQYTKFVKPAFEEFCQPTKKYADVIIPRGADNEVAINLIVQTIRDLIANNKQQMSNSAATTTAAMNVRRTRYASDSLTLAAADALYGSVIDQKPSSSRKIH